MDKRIAKLEELLRQQISMQDRLGKALQAKMDACRKADRPRIIELTELENTHLQALAELEKQRLVVVAEITQLIDPLAQRPFRLRELAERLPEPARGRMLILRQQWEDKLKEVKRESNIARSAAELMLRHMQGLVQTITAAVSGIGTYSRTGGTPQAVATVSTFSATA